MSGLRGLALGGLESPRRAAFLLAALALSGTYLVKTRWHSPRIREAARIEARLERLKAAADRDDVDGAAAAGAALAADLPLHERRLAELEKMIPTPDGVASILSELSAAERQAGVEVTLLRPAPPRPGDFYELWSYELGVRGGYAQIGAFLTAIGSLPQVVATDGLVVAADHSAAEGAAAGRDGNAAVPAVAGFTMHTYVRRGESAATDRVPNDKDAK